MYKRRGMKSPVNRTTTVIMGIIVLAVVLVLIMFGYVAVSGESMLPTIQPSGEGVIIFRYANVERGDIVVIDNSDYKLHPTDKLLIKRVIAVGGDTISYKPDYSYGVQGKIVLKVNGVEIDEPYIRNTLYASDVDNRLGMVEHGMTVPEGCVYVMGDNRINSHDSRNFGAIKLDRLTGEAILLWGSDGLRAIN